MKENYKDIAEKYNYPVRKFKKSEIMTFDPDKIIKACKKLYLSLIRDIKNIDEIH